MKKAMMVAAVLTLSLAAAAPAKADRILLQFLGESINIGDLQDANSVAGTAVTVAEIEAAVGRALLPEDFLGCNEVPMVDPATKVLLGPGIDCLWAIDGGVIGVSYFVLPGGTLVKGVKNAIQNSK